MDSLHEVKDLRGLILEHKIKNDLILLLLLVQEAAYLYKPRLPRQLLLLPQPVLKQHQQLICVIQKVREYLDVVLEGREVLLVEQVGEDLLVNFEVKGAMLHREDVDEVREDLFLDEIVNPVLPSLFLLVERGLLEYLR